MLLVPAGLEFLVFSVMTQRYEANQSQQAR